MNKTMLGKKEYEIKFTMNTLCMMAEQGLEIAKVTEGGMQNLPMTRDLFYYGLKHADKKLTKNQAGDIMDELIAEGISVNDIFVEIMLALSKSLGFSEVMEDALKGEEVAEEGKQ